MKGSCGYDSRVAPVNVFLIAPQFRCLPIRAGRGGKRLPLVLCDTMGLESHPDAGLALEDLYNIYKGRIADRYQVHYRDHKSFPATTARYIIAYDFEN